MNSSKAPPISLPQVLWTGVPDGGGTNDEQRDRVSDARAGLFVAVCFIGLGVVAACTRRIPVQLFVDRVTESSLVPCEYAAYLYAGNKRIEAMCKDAYEFVMVPEPIYWSTVHLNAIVCTGATVLVAASLALVFLVMFRDTQDYPTNSARVAGACDALSAGLNAAIHLSGFALHGLPSAAFLAALALCRMNIDAAGYRSRLSCVTATLCSALTIALFARVPGRLDASDDAIRSGTMLCIGLVGYDVLGTLAPHGAAYRELASPSSIARAVRMAKAASIVVSYVLLWDNAYYLTES